MLEQSSGNDLEEISGGADAVLCLFKARLLHGLALRRDASPEAWKASPLSCGYSISKGCRYYRPPFLYLALGALLQVVGFRRSTASCPAVAVISVATSRNTNSHKKRISSYGYSISEIRFSRTERRLERKICEKKEIEGTTSQRESVAVTTDICLGAWQGALHSLVDWPVRRSKELFMILKYAFREKGIIWDKTAATNF